MGIEGARETVCKQWLTLDEVTMALMEMVEDKLLSLDDSLCYSRKLHGTLSNLTSSRYIRKALKSNHWVATLKSNHWVPTLTKA